MKNFLSILCLIISTCLFIASMALKTEQSKQKEIVQIRTITLEHDWDSNWYMSSDSSHSIQRTVDFDDVFPFSIKVMVVIDPKKFIRSDFKIFYPYFGDTKGANGSAFTMYDPDNYPGIIFIVLPHGVNEETKAHEASHAVDRIMKNLGLEGTECRAYMIGHVIKQIGEIPEWKISVGHGFATSQTFRFR